MIRRFFTRILMVILIAACGYNGWQVRQLQAEVARLKTRPAVSTRPAPVQPWPLTRQELRRGANGLKNAVDGARSPQSLRALRDLRARTERLRRQADSLWREVRSVTGPASP